MNEEYAYKYMQLVLTRKFNKLDKTTQHIEIHHITPRFYFRHNSIDIDNSTANTVAFTHEEHVLAHYYLFMALDTGKYKDLAHHAYISMSASKAQLPVVKQHVIKTIRCINIKTLEQKTFSKDATIDNDYMLLSEFKSMKRKHIHNLTTNKNTLFPIDLPVPNGYARGYYVSKENSQLFSQKLKLQHKNKTINNTSYLKSKGKIRAFNIKTMKIFFVEALSDIPADCLRYSIQKYQTYKQKSKAAV